jgi:gliding motility-associated lipoprotein GldK
MKKFLAIIVLFLVASCSNIKNDRGELVGIKTKKFFNTNPQGMVLIPSGSFTMGPSNPSLVLEQNPTLKTVSMKAFYMDETEITNSEYKQFVNWVRDSIVRHRLAVASFILNKGELDEEDGKPKEGQPLRDFYPIYPKQIEDIDDEDAGTVYERYRSSQSDKFDIKNKSLWRIDWDAKLTYDPNQYPDIEYAKILEGDNNPGTALTDKISIENLEKGFFIPAEETPNELRAFRTTGIKYNYREFDKVESKWSDYKSYEIYPDTTVWFKDFNYSYNDPMHTKYFYDDAFTDYPVVGVSWEQAKAFAHWRTFYKNQHQRKQKKNVQLVAEFRLPTEAEWEYAARGGLERAEYPWGGPYTYDDKGCFLANFKPERGDYVADNYFYTVEANAFKEAINGYGLYNMSGNVSEWTDSNYEKSANDFVSSLNPNIGAKNTNNKKVVRGGSWKDVAHFLKVSTRDYEFQDKKRSYIGFRTVQSYLGEDLGVDENPNKIF